MFTPSEKIFSVYEKPEASEPTDRVALLREGFHWGALIFGGFWLVYKRLWRVLVVYLLAAGALVLVADALHVPEAIAALAQLLLQVLLAYHVNDAQGWFLMRRGYRFAGILTAESDMQAQRRYYEHAA